jgi:beta-glucosidase
MRYAVRNEVRRALHVTTAGASIAVALAIVAPVACSLRPGAQSSAGGGGAGQTGSTGGNPVTGTGGSVQQDDPSCMMYTAPRANVLSPVDPSVPALIGQMTLDEKIALLSGGPVLTQFWTEDFAATGDPKLGIPDYQMRDGPRGVHLRQGDTAVQSTTWAVSEARAASFDADLEYRVGKAQGEEMRAFKYELSLAPVVNVLRHPAWARAQETYGEDPILVGEMGAAFVNGLQLNAGACAKHFTGNDTDDNRNATTAIIDEQTLRENYTRPWEIIVKKADPACVMAAYNGVNDAPFQTCTVNHHLLTDILRTDWGWTGFVVSDWWASKGTGDININAGLDLEMSDNHAFVTLSSDVMTSKVPGSRIDEAATRILNVRTKLKGLDPTFESSQANPGIVNDAGHVALAQETAEKGAVLLKNDNILPLGSNATTAGMGTANVKSIIVLGPDAAVPNAALVATANMASGLGDRGSSDTTPPHAISFLQGLQTRATGITVTSSANAADASKADIAIIPVTMAHEDEGEHYDGGLDRQDLTLSGVHPRHWGTNKPAQFIAQAAAANPNVIVLLAVGSAIVMEDWMGSAKAIVQTFYPGQEGGTAAARLLFGDINFSGKLPFTVAQNPTDYPAFQNMAAMVTFDYLHGYRKFEKENRPVRFWFGYGMSYTTYEYSNLTLLCSNGISSTGRLNVAVTVKNTGKMAGDEVVQAYVGYPNTAVTRPVKELKAFQRVTLMPGESKTIQFLLPAEDMAYWDTGKNGWVVEKVGHTVLVGPSADPAKLLSQPFTIN